MTGLSGYLPELYMGLSGLLTHKLRSLFAMLGMIFGVGAVVAALAVTSGARDEMTRYAGVLGADNIVVEAKEAADRNELERRRMVSSGLTFGDFRGIEDGIPHLEWLTPRKRFQPARALPKPDQDIPPLVGVRPDFLQIDNLKLADGRFFDAGDDARSAPVCVLGEAAKVNLLGYGPAVGKYIKLDDTWLQVIGVLAGQAAEGEPGGLGAANRDDAILAPLNTVMRRFEDGNSYLKDEIDGIYIKAAANGDAVAAASQVEALLNAAHHGAGDFTVVAPAALLERRRRTEFTFNLAMLSIAGISLLVGGVGIMSVILAGVLERAREIGIRRTLGARKADIVRQFLTEAVLVSIAGGIVGIVFGFLLARLIPSATGWSTSITLTSIAIAFGVSAAVGVASGIFPAMQAARLDPIEAMRHE